MIYQSASNTGVQGYMPELSTTIKNLAGAGTGSEVFDLGEQWKLIDNLVVSFVNCADSTGGAVTCNFSDLSSNLIGTGAALNNTLPATNSNGTTRVSVTSTLQFIVFSLKVTARYVRIRVLNGATAQGATAYIDVRGFGLMP
jgi:hypothetical protein